ncbi:CLUMA_CG017203, isoform A [Clunio marinus]|uniref:CLUMA_CG017203, isoform A n=1 Tax=Clunio marinus TaxID=568069 RepID=A0A1J1IWM5_9DIPT|nr:CLUMA_CG017203, isoform A [Clunio marinus]
MSSTSSEHLCRYTKFSIFTHVFENLKILTLQTQRLTGKTMTSEKMQQKINLTLNKKSIFSNGHDLTND